MIKNNLRILRWFLFFLLTSAVLIFITMGHITSLLAWQSDFLSRSFFILVFCFAMCLFGLLRGPTPADRAVSMNAMGVLVVGFCAILSVFTGRDWYIDIAIAWALQGFVSALSLAKYMEGKDFDE